jgi:signal transduction histidine kinase/ligand-binding sensor domain-containing protein
MRVMSSGRGRNVAGLRTLMSCVLLACSSSASALNPALDISQYAHTAWRIRDGFSKGVIKSIAQTPDGYLWLATDFGLLRFDGVRAAPWHPPHDQPLASADIWSVLAARDGALWIGTAKGLARWKGGKLTQYPELSGQIVAKLLEDREGTVWATGLAVPTGLLCAVRERDVTCDGADGVFGYGPFGLYEDRRGNLWAGISDALLRWRPGPPTLVPLPGERDGIQGFVQDGDDALLITTAHGIRRVVDGRPESYLPLGRGQQLRALHILRDRDGGLWIGTMNQGLVHMYRGRTDVFAQADGLSGDTVLALFEDREGNIWAATPNGLDRFRELAVSTLSEKQGVSNAPVVSVVADRTGNVWIGTSDGLRKWNQGRITAYRQRRIGLPVPGVGLLFPDDRGRIWAATSGALGYLEHDRFVVVPSLPVRAARSMAQDTQTNLWVTDQILGLLRLSPAGDVEPFRWDALGRRDFATALVADQIRGGVWLGFWDGGIVHLKDGSIRAQYAAGDGLGEGRINGFHIDAAGTLWIATEGGLSRLRNGRVATLSTRNGLPCDTAHWVIEDDADSFWLNMACGLVRVARSEVDASAADPKRSIAAVVFDNSDGLRAQALMTGYDPHVAKSSDGRLWFTGVDGVHVVDPRRLPFNKLPPPVHVEQITADRRTYDVPSEAGSQLRLPPLIRDLQIDYTALSLVAPEKNRFRYKLEGWDREWQDVGIRRQAFYNNIPPRTYRFRVTASNNSGVWNEAGAFLDFAVAPAYYQTMWFRVTVLAGFLLLLGALYQLRLRQVSHQFNMSLEARVSERTRIARDLHDTLLQSFQGVLLNFHAVTFLLPDRPGEARTSLQAAIEQASKAITEGRDAVQGLRSSTVVTSDLARAIGALGEELGDRSDSHAPDFRVNVEGTPRDLAPILGDEVYRIAGEALRNAFRHARATQIEVEIHYDRKQFRLSVRDDGKGIEPSVLVGGARAGHFGLAGMHERAKLVEGTLAVWSERDSGTEAELAIPAAIAYARTERTA